MENGQYKKRCSGCKEHLPANTDYFYRSGSGKHGVGSLCRNCYKKRKPPTESKVYVRKLTIYFSSGEAVEHENFAGSEVDSGFLKVTEIHSGKIYHYNISNIIKFEESFDQ